jgi:hypothetical protein
VRSLKPVRQRGAGACGTVDCCHGRESQTHPWEAPPGGIHRPVNQGVTPPQLTTEPAHPRPGQRPGSRLRAQGCVIHHGDSQASLDDHRKRCGVGDAQHVRRHAAAVAGRDNAADMCCRFRPDASVIHASNRVRAGSALSPRRHSRRDCRSPPYPEAAKVAARNACGETKAGASRLTAFALLLARSRSRVLARTLLAIVPKRR